MCVFRSGGLEDLDFLTGELGGLQVSIMDALISYGLLQPLLLLLLFSSFLLLSSPPLFSSSFLLLSSPPLFSSLLLLSSPLFSSSLLLLQLSGGMVGQNPPGGGFQQPGVSLGGGFQQPGVSLGGGFQQPGVSLGGGGGLGLDFFSSGVSTQAPTGFSLPKTVSCS